MISVYAGVRTTRMPGASFSATNGPARRMLPLGQHGLEEHVVGLVVRGHMPLHAVEDVVFRRRGLRWLQVGDVGAGEVLGQRVALVSPALDGRDQVGLALMVVGDAGTSRGGVVRHQARALVDRPPCSCTRTCCRAVQT